MLSMCSARDKVWMGFEIGYLIVFDANTKKPYAQVRPSVDNLFATDMPPAPLDTADPLTLSPVVLGQAPQGHPEYGVHPCSAEGLRWPV